MNILQLLYPVTKKKKKHDGGDLNCLITETDGINIQFWEKV